MDQKDAEASAADAVSRIFDDFESKGNIVGLYSLLLQIDQRINPELYAEDKRDKL